MPKQPSRGVLNNSYSQTFRKIPSENFREIFFSKTQKANLVKGILLYISDSNLSNFHVFKINVSEK